MSPPRLGENKEVMSQIWSYHKSIYDTEIVDEFLSLIKPDRDEVADEINKEFSFEFQWKTKDSITRPKINKIDDDLKYFKKNKADEGNVNLFYVDENNRGNFHFQGFGLSVGGDNRDKSFIIKVRDKNGGEIATSKPTTAIELNIASRGRRDYDKDNFHQSYFCYLKDNEEFIPNSPIARRVEWNKITPNLNLLISS
jgi:hypothetical protein